LFVRRPALTSQREGIVGWFFPSPGKGKHFFSRGKEKISRAEDFSGLFFLPPCLGKHFSGLGKEKISREKHFPGKAEDFFGKAKENFRQDFLSHNLADAVHALLFAFAGCAGRSAAHIEMAEGCCGL